MKPIKLADVRKHTSRRAEQLNPWAPFRPAHGLSPSSTACGRSEPRGRFRLKKDEDLRETSLGARATMTKPTVAGNAYRWAHPAIEQIVSYRPSVALDFLRADAATKHFVALAVRGWEAHQGRSERVLWQLSGDIFFARARSYLPSCGE
jgi:hypothetical protein